MGRVDRRSSILAAATEEFASAGFAGGRVERIAKSARVNKQLIFHYFRSKDDLYAAAVAAAITRPIKVPSVAGSPPEAIRASVSHVLALLNPGQLPLSALAEASVPRGSTESVRTAVSLWLMEAQSLLKVTIPEGQRLGFFRDDVWPDAASKLIMGQCVGASLARAASGLAARMEDASMSDFSTAIGDWAVEYCAWR